jgi:mono/diheme cytochrome c family protein
MRTARRFLTVLSVTAALVAGARAARGQTSGPSTQRSTSSGVYSADQATRGRDVYAMQCKSCHTPASHTGAIFAAWWDRKPLSELYQFIVTRMPKNEPGSLQAEEYVDVMAYLLKLNELPSGNEPLPADSVAMKKIRIEVGKRDP